MISHLNQLLPVRNDFSLLRQLSRVPFLRPLSLTVRPLWFCSSFLFLPVHFFAGVVGQDPR